MIIAQNISLCLPQSRDGRQSGSSMRNCQEQLLRRQKNVIRETIFSHQDPGVGARNRVVMSAMGTHESAASEDGRMVTDKLIAYHVARAKGRLWAEYH